MDEKNIYEKAIYLYGTEKQIDMVIEECLELAHELLKMKRNRNTKKDVMSELVDVQIMINQLKIILDDNYNYNCIMNYKLDRLRNRMDKRL